eukprot:jgi/Psemu1/58783/gm1.58783_g
MLPIPQLLLLFFAFGLNQLNSQFQKEINISIEFCKHRILQANLCKYRLSANKPPGLVYLYSSQFYLSHITGSLLTQASKHPEIDWPPTAPPVDRFGQAPLLGCTSSGPRLIPRYGLLRQSAPPSGDNPHRPAPPVDRLGQGALQSIPPKHLKSIPPRHLQLTPCDTPRLLAPPVIPCDTKIPTLCTSKHLLAPPRTSIPHLVSANRFGHLSAPPVDRLALERDRRLQRLSAPPSGQTYPRLHLQLTPIDPKIRLLRQSLILRDRFSLINYSNNLQLQLLPDMLTYTEYYQTTTSPLGVGPARDLAYQTIYDYFAEETATPILLGRLFNLFEPEAVGALGIFLTGTFGRARLRLVHSLRKYPGPLTAPSTNKGKAFGYLDDIEGDAGELVLVDAALLEQAPKTLVLSLDRRLDAMILTWRSSPPTRPASSPSNWCPYS